MKRWIIRGFFIALLLLFVGGWAGSFWYGCSIDYWGRDHWTVDLFRGKMHFDWAEGSQAMRPLKGGWDFYGFVIDDKTDPEVFVIDFGLQGYHCLGFYMGIEPAEKWITIPVWFLTTVLAALFWFVWRKTRPKEMGRAFPVDVDQPNEE